MSKNIPEKVSNRLTLYHSIMVEYIEEGIETISSPQIAQRLGIDDSQVRKDFKLLNNAGKCRVGYLVKDLKDSIEKTLGFAKTKDAFIVEEINVTKDAGAEGNYTKEAIKKYKVTLVPTIVFVNKEGKVIHKEEGAMKSSEIIEIIDGNK